MRRSTAIPWKVHILSTAYDAILFLTDPHPARRRGIYLIERQGRNSIRRRSCLARMGLLLDEVGHLNSVPAPSAYRDATHEIEELYSNAQFRPGARGCLQAWLRVFGACHAADSGIHQQCGPGTAMGRVGRAAAHRWVNRYESKLAYSGNATPEGQIIAVDSFRPCRS